MPSSDVCKRGEPAAAATPSPVAPLLSPTPPQMPPRAPRLPLAPPAAAPAGTSLFDLPEPLVDIIFSRLGLCHLATASCASSAFLALCQRALGLKTGLTAEQDLSLLPRQHNFLLMLGPARGATGSGSADGNSGAACRVSLRRRVLGYLPAALHYASMHCPALQQLHLELPPPQLPLSAAADAVERAVAGEAWQQQPAALMWGETLDSACPPVDGYLLKLAAQCCPDLRSLRLVNITNNATCNRLIRPKDSCLALLARSCPLLEELVLGHRGGQDCMFDPSSPFYLEDVTDAGLRAVAQHCTRLRRLGLLRCSRVGDPGLAAIARHCRHLTALTLHDCPGVSERGLLEVGERCAQLRVLDVTVARRAGGLLMGEDGEQLGFRALFTIAANCPLLEELNISEEGLETAVVRDDSLQCIAQGCPRLRRLALRHCGGVTDEGLQSLVARCKQLQELSLEHTAVGDAGVLAAVRALPALRHLSLSTYSSSLGHLAFLPGGALRMRGMSDAALHHIAEHCTGLHQLTLTGSRRVTDAGLHRLAQRPCFTRHLTQLTINHTAATDVSVCLLLECCGALRALSLRGLLFNADATAARLAASCRHLTSLDLRHCSTLSDAGLAHLSRLPFLRTLQLSFCVRITDAGLLMLAGAAPAGHNSGGGPSGGASWHGSTGHNSWHGTSGHNSGGTNLMFAAIDGKPHGKGEGISSGNQRQRQAGEEGGEAWEAGVGGKRGAAGSGNGDGGFSTGSGGGGGSGGSGGSGSFSGGSSSGGNSSGGAGKSAAVSLLREVELYHVPQVTQRGIWALAEACPHLQHINIGKCRLVRVESLRGLLARRPLRISASHYLDS